MFVQGKRGSYIYLCASFFAEEFVWELKKVKMREYGIFKQDLTLMASTPIVNSEVIWELTITERNKHKRQSQRTPPFSSSNFI